MSWVRFSTLYTALFVLLAIGSFAGEASAVGKPMSDRSVVTIGELLTNPDRFVDTVVKVEGKITDVCPKAGCWIDIEDGGHEIRFKVKDYEIVFAPGNIAQSVVAEGLFTRIEMTPDQAESYARHLAEEKGDTYDPSSSAAATMIYRIDGTGAILGAVAKSTTP